MKKKRRIKRHHNNTGYRQIQNGKTYHQIKAMERIFRDEPPKKSVY